MSANMITNDRYAILLTFFPAALHIVGFIGKVVDPRVVWCNLIGVGVPVG
jgi:hypothetical protein